MLLIIKLNNYKMSLYSIIQKGFLDSSIICKFIYRNCSSIDRISIVICEAYDIFINSSLNNFEQLETMEEKINLFEYIFSEINSKRKILMNMNENDYTMIDINKHIHKIKDDHKSMYGDNCLISWLPRHISFETDDFSIIIPGKEYDIITDELTPNYYIDIISNLNDDNYHVILRNIIKKHDFIHSNEYNTNKPFRIYVPSDVKPGNGFLYRDRVISYPKNSINNQPVVRTDKPLTTTFNILNLKHRINNVGIMLSNLSINLKHITIGQVTGIYNRQNISIFLIKDNQFIEL